MHWVGSHSGGGHQPTFRCPSRGGLGGVGGRQKAASPHGGSVTWELNNDVRNQRVGSKTALIADLNLLERKQP